MTLIACPVPGKAKSKMLCDAFIAGAPKSASGYVFYGVKAGNFTDWKRARASGEDWYFIDNSYFDSARGSQFRVTKNRLQHDGRGESDGKRFARLAEKIHPLQSWNMHGRVVFVEQSDDHMQYTLMGDPWLDPVLLAYAGDPAFHVRLWSPNKPKIQVTLAEDLIGARRLITHTSAAAVMAILAGVPVDCAPQCAAFGMTGKPDRLPWASVLADNQFTLDELKNGLAWRTLNP